MPELTTYSSDAAVSTRAGFEFPARALAVFSLVIAAAAFASHFIGGETTAAAALKVVLPSLALGIVPGILLILHWRPRPQMSMLEVLGFGAALSFGIVHLATIVAISVHASPDLVLTALGVLAAIAAISAMFRPPLRVLCTTDEVIVIGLLVAVAVPLYVQGSPFDAYEDQVLVSIVRRLSALEAPRIDNFYVAPGVVYTYPFPGTLYLMALAARLGDIDPLFLYHKLRFLWGPVALMMLHLAARSIFGFPALACAITVTAAALVGSGAFAMVAGFPSWWGQLTPYSYVPDVAMTVFLPALLVLSFEYLQAGTARARAFFLAGALMVVLMLTMIHIREIIQFAAYVGCFVLVAAAARPLRPYLGRALALLLATLLVAAIYTRWQAAMAPGASEIVGSYRAELVSVAAKLPFRALVAAPASETLGDFIQDFDQIFAGVTPFLLFAGPPVVLLFRRRPMVWLVSSSMFVYLAVMSVPLLAIPYVYLTYFEILHIPVRNIIFFAYLIGGALVYVTVIAVARVDRTRLLMPAAAGVVLGLLALLATLCLNRSHAGFFAPLIAAYGLTFLFIGGDTLPRRLRVRSAVFLITAAAALVGLWPDHAPTPRTASVNVRWTSGLPEDQRTALERRFGLTNGERSGNASDDLNVWGYRLTDLSEANVRTLVTHPDVVDTNDIDRSTFRVPPQPPRTDHPFVGVERVTWLQYPGMLLLVLTALAVWAIAIVAPAAIASVDADLLTSPMGQALSRPFHTWALPYVLFIIPFVLWSARPTLSPLSAAPVAPAGRANTPRALFEQIPCVATPQMPARFAEEEIVLPERTNCPPPPVVVAWVQEHVPVDAVFAIDRWTPYPPQVFTPQQAVVFPTLDASFIREETLFRDYYRVFGERVRRYRVQPFFNAVETPEDRAAFVQALGVTHVLVSPAHYDELRPVLDGLPDQFALRYDDARWAVYEAIRKPN